MQGNPQEVLGHFHHVLESLKDWPDRDMILKLTALAEHNIDLAPYFVEIVVNRLINPATNSSYKRPIFYLIDSIMKHVCGPFPVMFSKQFGDKFVMILKDIHDKVDREKMTFLLGTWDERKFFPADLLQKMKFLLSRPPIASTYVPPPQPFTGQQQVPAAPRLPVPVALPVAAPRDHPVPEVVMDATFMDLVKSEMVTLLHKLFADINAPHPMSLEEVAVANPALFAQLRVNAEASAKQIMAVRNIQTTPAMQQPGSTAMAMAQAQVKKRPLEGESRFSRFGGSAGTGAQVAIMPTGPAPEPLDGRIVNGYICETLVRIDLEHAQQLAGEVKAAGLDKLALRLEGLVTNARSAPPLPPILFGPLPLEPLFPTQRVQPAAPVRKLPKPEFVVVDLATRRPDAMLRALYFDRPHQFHEDGLRFRTLAQLQQHSNAHFERKKVVQRRRDSKEARQFRELYCKPSQWISDFNALDGGSSAGGSGSSSGPGGMSLIKDEGEEFIMPADEFFTRCPVSKERFETFWDSDDAEMMFRHAVKVLVTDAADPEVFKLGQPCPGEPSVHYVVVHKLLVLDKWLADGKATALKDLSLRYEHVGEWGHTYVARMTRAAGEEQDEEDVFVILELHI